jgi:hypothetical protein
MNKDLTPELTDCYVMNKDLTPEILTPEILTPEIPQR